jgi:hypothetical protein
MALLMRLVRLPGYTMRGWVGGFPWPPLVVVEAKENLPSLCFFMIKGVLVGGIRTAV